MDSLTAAQQEIVDALGATPEERPTFSEDLRGRLHDDLAEAFGPWVGGYSSDEPLFVNKHKLSQAHGCEARHVYEESTPGFDWSIPTARGSVTHKAIELSVHWRGTPHPLDLVDEALGRLAGEDRGLGDFIAHLPEADRAQLRSDVNDRVAAFCETWPPLKPAWRPVTESRVRAEFLGGRIAVSGKVDLTLGHPDGNRAGKVIIDLKSGRFRANHRDDLRFYSLLETLRVGTPPRLMASYYLDQGRFEQEHVSVEVLEVAAERLIRGVEVIVELATGSRQAVKRPSLGCRWCPLVDDCTEGTEFIAAVDGGEGSDF